MKELMRLIICFLCLILFNTSHSQTDSLIKVLHKTKVDSERVDLINRIVYAFEQSNLDSSDIWAKKGFVLSTKTSNNKGLGYYYNHKGRLKLYTQNYDSSIFYFQKASVFFTKVNFVKGMISCNNNIGASYGEMGDYDKALEFHFKNVEIGKKANDKESIGNSYINIGNVYNQKNNYYLSVQHTLKAIPIFEELKMDRTLGTCYYNLAASNFHLKNHAKAYEFALKSIDYYKKSNSPNPLINNYSLLSNISYAQRDYDGAIANARKGVGLAIENGNAYSLFFLYLNISQGFEDKNQLDSALKYAEKGVDIALQLNYDVYKLKSYYQKGRVLYDLNRPKEAIAFLDTSLALCIQLSDISLEADCNYYLALSYKKLNNTDQAYTYLERNIKQRDTLFKINNTKTIFELQTLFETEKKELKIQKQSIEISAKQKQNEAKNRLLLYGSIGMVAIAIFAFFAFRNYLVAKKANVIIQHQKENLEIKNLEISHQKELVEHKQKEIIDSINYAKRIQQAVLTGEEIWSKVSKEHFILFQPKDIVSGDFYWAYNTPNNRSVFALADCTGHGVPGGFMSMLGNSFLNEIVVDNKIFKANEILNKLREKIISALEQEGHSEQKDGMDISLCVWNKLDNTLEFAGANNPLWILSESEFIEYKADKMPIGTYTETATSFSSHMIQLEKGDIIYLITDGFADQFGGPKGKKFKYKPLQELLFECRNKPMSIQKEFLAKALSEWKENYEQVDDISIIGVKCV